MPNLNRMTLMGHCGKDAETRTTQSGKQCTTVSVATNYKYKDQSGNEVSKTEWHRVVGWGWTAELMAEQFRKGDAVYVEGRMQYREWEDDAGVKRTVAEIIAYSVSKFVPSPQQDGGAGKGRGSRTAPPPPPEDEVPF
jgi:single-strand DNA-binding protein